MSSANAFKLDWSQILSFGKELSLNWSKNVLFGKELPFPTQQILDYSKLKEFADNSFKSDENGRKFSKWVENTVGK